MFTYFFNSVIDFNNKEVGMKKIFWLVSILILFSFATNSALAAFRCGNLIVEEGTDGMQIQSECGKPVSKEKFYLDKYGEVKKWTYGPDVGYLYIIYLFAGKVVKIEEIQQ